MYGNVNSKSLLHFFLIVGMGLLMQACGGDKSAGKFASTSGLGLDSGNGSALGAGTGGNLGTASNLGAGAGNNGMAGTSGSGYKGPYGDFTKTFILSGADGAGFPPGADQDPTQVYYLGFAGATKIFTFTCVPYKLRTMNVNGQNIQANKNFQVTVRDDGTNASNIGGWFTDSDCQTGASMLSFSVGETEKTIYYKTAVAGIRVYTASGSPGPLVGRFAVLIDNNPNMNFNLCFNYEDMPNGDGDKNDVVIKPGNGSSALSYLANNTIVSRSNGPVNFAVSGTSACQTRVVMMVFDSKGVPYSQAVIEDPRKSANVTLIVRYGFTMNVYYSSLGGCDSGGFQPMPKLVAANRLAVTNACRGASDEGKRM